MIWDTTMFFQLLLSGLLVGGIYALISEGLTLIYGTMDLINFAHGSFFMLAMYATFWMFYLWGFDPYLSIPVIVAIFFGLGWIVQKVFIDRILEAPVIGQFLLTFAFMLFIENMATVVWTTDARMVTPEYGLITFKIFGIRILFPMLLAFVGSLVSSIIGYVFLMKTWVGLALRSTAQSRDVAQLVGVNVSFIFALTWAIGLSFVGLAGLFISVVYPVSPYIGMYWLLPAFVVVVLGGLGNYVGALFGGLIIGVTEALIGFFVAPMYKQVGYMLIFILILLMRPEGLFGRRGR